MPVLEKWTPFRELELMEQRMRRVFPGLFVAPTFTPAADVYETNDEFVFEVEVPGYEEKELAVEIHDHTVTIRGERAVEKEKKEKALRLHERLESTFERSFQLPIEVDSTQLKAVYGKGVLTLHVPKSEQTKPLKVPIVKA
jgi:HSP20 family protein